MKIFNIRKRYVVGISSNDKIQFIEVKARNEKEALGMVTDVLLKCSIFPFVSENEFELTCRRI